MSEDSDLSSEKEKKKVQASKRTMSPKQKSRNFQPPPVPSVPSLAVSPVEDQSALYDENRKLRRKLKELSMRLDEQLQKAAENKLKQQSLSRGNGHPVSLESHPLQLQNAYKMIERLQKTVHDYESKESYQITLKRVMDLEGIIRKKESEIEQLKTEVKTLRKIIKDKERHVQELIQSTKRAGNPAEDIETINKLKAKLKKILEENELLKKKEMDKHEKLVTAERRIVELEQDTELPIGKEEGLLKDIDDGKRKVKELMLRIDRQNIYISKLNEKLTKDAQDKSRKGDRNDRTERNERTDKLSERGERGERRMTVARSLEDLPSLEKKINTSELLEHLPSPKQGIKLRRY